MWPFRRKDACTPERAAVILAECKAAGAREDALLDAWMDGPGKDYPRSFQMVQETEVSEPRPMLLMNDGWIEAFREWAAAQP